MKCTVTRNDIIRELKRIAFADFSHYASVETEDGIQKLVFSDTAALKVGDRRAVAMVKQGTRGVEVKLYDKMKALELLGRTIGLFSDKTDDGELLNGLRSILDGVGDTDSESCDSDGGDGDDAD